MNKIFNRFYKPKPLETKVVRVELPSKAHTMAPLSPLLVIVFTFNCKEFKLSYVIHWRPEILF